MESIFSSKILFVDDEEQVLRALKRTFLDSQFEIYLANSGEKALEVLNEIDIDVMITDIKMPYMDGYELLKIVKQKFPNVIRLVLSGYSEEKLVFKSIQKGLAKMYLMKPWDSNDLIKKINRLIILKRELAEKKLVNIINDLNSLPTMLDIYNELTLAIDNDWDLKEITKIVEKDQSIAARVLQVANSAFYGVETASIQKAIIYLGLANIKSIVLSTTFFNSCEFDYMLYFNKNNYWEHANLTNKITTLLYKKIMNEKLPDCYATAGLLHDIGKIALIYFASKKEYKGITIDSINTLEKTIKITHEKLGGTLLELWNIPMPIIEAAVYHSDPLNDTIIHKELVSIVHIANEFANQISYKNPIEFKSDKVFEFLGVTKEYCYETIYNDLSLI